MLNLFHGDHTASSRTQLQSALANERARGAEILTLEGDKITPQDLESAILTNNLFTPTVIVIENLLSRLRSQSKDRCLEILTSAPSDKTIYLWEKKEVTKLTLNKLPKTTKISLSKTPTTLFALLDSLVPGNSARALELLHQTMLVSEEIVIFTLVSRQISSLIQIVGGGSPKTSPWQLAKLQSLSVRWSLPQLIHFHDELVRIDYSIKSGRSRLSYLDHLDILLATLLR